MEKQIVAYIVNGYYFEISIYNKRFNQPDYVYRIDGLGGQIWNNRSDFLKDMLTENCTVIKLFKDGTREQIIDMEKEFVESVIGTRPVDKVSVNIV